MSVTNLTDTVRTQTLEYVKQGQEFAVQTVGAWANAVGRFAPDASSYRLYADRLPKPVEAADQIFDFAEQLVAAQRQFAHSLLAAVTPAVEAAQRTVEEATAPNGKPKTTSKAKA